LRKYAKAEEGQEPLLDLRFMRDKFKNRINVENVDKLIAFEKSALERASRFFHQQNDYTIEMGVGDVKTSTEKLEDRIKQVVSALSELKKSEKYSK
jgi:ribosomal protein L1